MIFPLLLATAIAPRPTLGVGLYHYEDDDVIESIDGDNGVVRVHYSVEGPNQCRMTDEDADGVPDFAELVAEHAEAVLLNLEDAGFRSPLSEADMGLDELGGSGAFDFYLVDFNGTGDGQFGADACDGNLCSGFMMMENDFYGYGYSSMDTAVATLTSHELFHAVQAAYAADQPSWLAEGTAVWAELFYDPESEDFMTWSGRYLEEPSRPLDRPPGGAFTGWEYGTGLFFGFLDAYAGTETLVSIQEELAVQGGEADLEAIEASVVAVGADFDEAWHAFSAWNLATGPRAGGIESYPYAERLDEVPPTNHGATLVDDERVYPLSTAYLRVDHPGGDLWLGLVDEVPGLHFELFPSQDGKHDPVLESIGTWDALEPGLQYLGDLEARSYWLVISNSAREGDSVAFDYCLGDAGTMLDCGLEVPSDDPSDDDDGAGCSVASSSTAGLAWLPVVAVAWRRRR